MPWEEGWLDTIASAQRALWRGVEAQHRVATMRLADNLEEQALLEQLLEESKPPPPPAASATSYLVFTPFRYVSEWPSRFRRPNEPGVWYGADEPLTVAAELAHWRHAFFMDSEGLRDKPMVTEHTFFQARFTGSELDITRPPWSAHRARSRHPTDYAACQDLASRARGHHPPLQSIRYESARSEGGMCQVVFAVESLGVPDPQLQQTWICKTATDFVLFSHDGEMVQFEMAN
jgi:hypothetical protein